MTKFSWFKEILCMFKNCESWLVVASILPRFWLVKICFNCGLRMHTVKHAWEILMVAGFASIVVDLHMHTAIHAWQILMVAFLTAPRSLVWSITALVLLVQ